MKKVLLALVMTLVYRVNSATRLNQSVGTTKVISTENTTDYRIPDYIVPTEYSITLAPFFNNFTFDGVVRITAEIAKTTSQIVLHSGELQIQHIVVLKTSNKNVQIDLLIKSVKKNKKYDFLSIQMKSPLQVNTNITIKIAYSGLLIDNQAGIYKRWHDFEGKRRYIIGTHLQPIGARNVFPCFDEPGFKAVFQMNVAVPTNYTALSNMPVKIRSAEGITEFEKTPPMSTYLVALVVSDFDHISTKDEKHLYRAWADPTKMDQLIYPFSVLSRAIEFFENKLGIPYALPKLDMVAMPDTLGAMENWGLPIYRESYAFYDANTTSLTQKKVLRNAITHELGHQWFGNLVTPKRWDFLWLSEAFGAYFESHAYEDAVESWKLGSQFVVNEMQPSFEVDASLGSQPMTRNVYSPSEIAGIFDTIVYTKGASVVRMLEKILGPKMFYGALSRYLSTNRCKTATPETLYRAVEEELKFNNYNLNTTVSTFLDSWTLQAGFPVINVHFHGDVAHLNQNRFLLNFSESEIQNKTKWIVPLNWASSSKPNFNNTKPAIWLTSYEQSVTIKNACKDWVIFNVQQAGYYRVNYDMKMWRRIIKALKSKDREIIHEINRAALVDDLLNFARSGLQEYDMALSALQYLTNETNYVPWKAAFQGFEFLKKRLSGHPEIYEPFKAHIISLLEPNYGRLGFYDIEGEEYLDSHLRELVLEWLCFLEYKDCIDRSLHEFQKLKNSSSYAVPANQQILVYRTAIKFGGSGNWDYLNQKLKNSSSAPERMNIVSALAYSKNSLNLERLLQKTLIPEEGIRHYEVVELLSYVVVASDIGRRETMKFIAKNYDEIKNYTTDESTAGDILGMIPEYLSTEKLIKEFDNYIKTNKLKMTNIYEDLEGALKSSEDQFSWFKQYSPKILEWLNRQYAR